MLEELENLFNLYKNDDNKFRFNNNKPNIIEFKNKNMDDFLFSLSLNFINNIYYIFLYIEKEDKIIFKGLIEKSKESISELYDKVYDDLSSLDMESFIKKYYLKLEQNFA